MTAAILLAFVASIPLALVVSTPAADFSRRPNVAGVAHVALYERDMRKARRFYEDLLGFAEPYRLQRGDGSDRIVFIKINDDQCLELFAEAPKADGYLNHISFYTNDAEAMRKYLGAAGVKVPEKVAKGRIGNSNFTVADPDQHIVEIVQYEPNGWTRQNKGKFMPDTRISEHMAHAGVLVRDLETSQQFYQGVLGFTEFWRGAARGSTTLSWVNTRVPDGTDYVEMMLYKEYPKEDQLGSKNHICLIVPDIERAVMALKSRPAFQDYGRDIKIALGVNRKRQANLFDPEGTRVELMEPNTIDGKPTPPSDAPAPLGEAKGTAR